MNRQNDGSVYTEKNHPPLVYSVAYDAHMSDSRSLAHQHTDRCSNVSSHPNAEASCVMFASVNLFFMFNLVFVQNWWPFPVAEATPASMQEKEKTRTDAGRFAALHIKLLHFL